MVLAVWLATAMSSRPSPLKSATAGETGECHGGPVALGQERHGAAPFIHLAVAVVIDVVAADLEDAGVDVGVGIVAVAGDGDVTAGLGAGDDGARGAGQVMIRGA